MELGELKSGEVYNKEILKLIQKLNISEENAELYKTGFHDMKRELQQENKALRLQADEYFELWQEESRKYETLTEHIRLKALHNPSISRYKDLMCFINEVEDK